MSHLISVPFVVAWPIWAGGYPTPEEAKSVFEERREEFLKKLHEIWLPPGYEPSGIQFETGTYKPVPGLSPRNNDPNSVEIHFSIASQKETRTLPATQLRKKILTTRLKTGIENFCRAWMPGAEAGANIYSATPVLPTEPAMSLAPHSEPLPSPAPPQPTRVSPQQTPPPRTRVFISYARKDGRWLSRLQTHLKPLVRDFGVDIWDDTRIKTGTKWRQELDNALHTAGVAILLVSANFLESDFIEKNELPPLLAAANNHNALILSIILSPCLYEEFPELCQYQAANDPKLPLIGMSKVKQEQVLKDVALRVKSHLNTTSQTPSTS